MAIEIFDNGSSIQISRGFLIRNILKSHIKEVSVVRDTIIRIALGNSLKDIYLDQLTVGNPPSASPADLRDQILAMLSGESIALLTSLKSDFSSVDSKLFFEPTLIEENGTGVTYKGYADTGKSNPADAGWAIQRITAGGGVTTTLWAGGKKTFDKVWNDRDQYEYS